MQPHMLHYYPLTLEIIFLLIPDTGPNNIIDIYFRQAYYGKFEKYKTSSKKHVRLEGGTSVSNFVEAAIAMWEGADSPRTNPVNYVMDNDIEK